MSKRNWKKYNKSLVQRGSLSFLIDPKTFEQFSLKKKKSRGRPLEFSNRLIEILLMIKIHYKLPYRMLEGFARFFFERFLPSTKVPSYSLICKRVKELELNLPKLSSRRPSVILVDATGIKVYGEGEWKVKMHGKGRPRKWIKLHIAIDEKTQEIVSEVTTPSSVGDPKAFPLLFEKTPHSVKTVKGDGAYDGKHVREAIRKRKAYALIPPPKTAVCKGGDLNRDQAVMDIRNLGGDLTARSIWGKLTGYSRRALVETAFSRYKKMFGDRAFSKTPERLIVENRLKCILLNKMIRASA